MSSQSSRHCLILRILSGPPISILSRLFLYLKVITRPFPSFPSFLVPSTLFYLSHFIVPSNSAFSAPSFLSHSSPIVMLPFFPIPYLSSVAPSHSPFFLFLPSCPVLFGGTRPKPVPTLNSQRAPDKL